MTFYSLDQGETWSLVSRGPAVYDIDIQGSCNGGDRAVLVGNNTAASDSLILCSPIVPEAL
jgi:hypothetical protein